MQRSCPSSSEFKEYRGTSRKYVSGGYDLTPGDIILIANNSLFDIFEYLLLVLSRDAHEMWLFNHKGTHLAYMSYLSYSRYMYTVLRLRSTNESAF